MLMTLARVAFDARVAARGLTVDTATAPYIKVLGDLFVQVDMDKAPQEIVDLLQPNKQAAVPRAVTPAPEMTLDQKLAALKLTRDQWITAAAQCEQCEFKVKDSTLGVLCTKQGCSACRQYVPFNSQCPEGLWDNRAPIAGVTLKTVQPLTFTRHGLNVPGINGMYRGCTVFLVCGGPSLADLDLSGLKQPGILTMAINNAPYVFRPNLWIAGDEASRFLPSIWRDPTILKFYPRGRLHEYLFNETTWTWTDQQVKDMPAVIEFNLATGFEASRWLATADVVWGNHTSSTDPGARLTIAAAIRILCSLGVSRIVLVGCDWHMTADHSYAFPQAREPGVVAANNRYYEVWNTRFTELEPELQAHGITVINATAGSQLTAFSRGDLQEEIQLALFKSGVDPKKENTKGLYGPKPPNPRIKPPVPAVQTIKEELFTQVRPSLDPVYVSMYTVDTPYKQEAEQLVETLKQWDLDYWVPGVEPQKSWLKNCALKPGVLWEARTRFPDRPIVWVDADARILKRPDFSFCNSYDLAAYNKRGEGYLAGTLYFAPTTEATAFLAAWNADAWSQRATTVDQLVLNRLLPAFPRLAVYNLPQPYTGIIGTLDRDVIIILHTQASRRLKSVVSVSDPPV